MQPDALARNVEGVAVNDESRACDVPSKRWGWCYWQTFCQRPLTTIYLQLVVPRGGRAKEGSGFS